MTANEMVALSLALILLLVRVECSNYPLKQRTRKTKTLELLTAQAVRDIGLSWSDDSKAKSLSPFRISLFTTDGDLPPSPSLASVQNAIDKFLSEELNAEYGWATQVKVVRSKVVTQSSTASSRRLFSRSLQITGSTLETTLDVTFEHEPSPNLSEVEAKVQSIMENDLAYLLSNLTEIAAGDPELENVDSIDYLGTVVQAPVASPTAAVIPSQNPPGVDISGNENTNEEKNPVDEGVNLMMVIPLVAASCVVIAAAALFTNMHRRNQQTLTNSSSSLAAPSSTREILHTDTGINLFWDGDSDVFSVEAALAESPHRSSKRKNLQDRSPAQQGSYRNQDENSTDHSDIFSGIDAETGASVVTSVEESPRSGRFETRSIFSFLSGFGSRGEASTVVHSNVSKKTPTSDNYNEFSPRASDAIIGHRSTAATYSNVMTAEGGTPRSRVSSLFTFSEEDTADLYSSGEEKENPDSEAPKGRGRPDFAIVDISGDKNLLGNDSTSRKELTLEEEIASCLSPSKNSSSAHSAWQNSGIDKSLTERIQMSINSPENSAKNIQSHTPSSVKSSEPNGATKSEGQETASRSDADATKGSPESSNLKNSSSSPKESFCYSKPNEDFSDARKKWSLFLSPFKKETSESTNPNNDVPKEELNIGTPKSMINMNENSSVTYDEGYHTDPGPSSTVKSQSRKLGKTNRPWQDDARDERDGPNEDETSSLRDESDPETSPTGGRRSRRHTKNPTGDGTNTYQNDTMGDWSLADYTNGDASLNEPAIPDMTYKRRPEVSVTQIEVNKSRASSSKLSLDMKSPTAATSPSYRMSPRTPRSAATNESTVSGLSGSLSVISEASGSKQLISDLVWLEKKINATTTTVVTSPKKGSTSSEKRDTNGTTGHADSLSFNSEDGASTSSSLGSAKSSESRKSSSKKLKKMIKSPKSQTIDTVHSIICRDCYAPPGKLKIVIHSTKDGPSVHTVKKGSSLEGHIFPGDLIISVDNVDTRSYSAEQVMKMMTAKTRFERKITVLHFEEQQVK